MTKEEQNLSSFLEKYKALETAIRQYTDYDGVYAYEQSLSSEPETIERMKLCRIIRNFIQHNQGSSKFVGIRTEMIQFIDDQIQVLKSKSKKVKEVMKKVPSIAETMSVKEALETANGTKYGIYPYVDADGHLLGLLEDKDLIAAYCDATKITSRMSSVIKPSIAKTLKTMVPVDANEPYIEHMEDGTFPVVTGDDVYKGIVFE